jgi:NADPH-dependent 2,4-dienoyl-CoA reductase/sulfur reductase-like enzyme
MESDMNVMKGRVAVIGAGPAGLSAALSLAEAGIPCTLLDEFPFPGGPAYRHRFQSSLDSVENDMFSDIVRRFENASDLLEWIPTASVLCIWKNNQLMVSTNDGALMQSFEKIIIATGSVERPMPFPGWTLPGVMAAGGISTFMHQSRVQPGIRALVSGAGPLGIGTAVFMHEAGIEVIAVLDTGNPPWLSDGFFEAHSHVQEAMQLHDNLRKLREYQIPLLTHHMVFEAVGQVEVTSVRYGALDQDTGAPLPETVVTDDADLVALAFGDVSNTDLSFLAGCRHVSDEVSGWAAERDAWMTASEKNIFAVGNCAASGTLQTAIAEGAMAAIRVAFELGFISEKDASENAQPHVEAIAGNTSFRLAVKEACRLKPGIMDAWKQDTLICRCEEVSVSDIRNAMEHGAMDLQALKLFTRFGMGPCQGRNCAPSGAMMMCHALGMKAEEAGRIHPRPPVRPVTLGELSRLKE